MLAVVTVTTLSDTVDFNDGQTSLREAIFAANTVPGADTIQFSPSLTFGGPAKILLTGGELAITDALTIDGPGADLLAIDAQQQSRIFDITAKAGDYKIVGLTLTGGKTTGDNLAIPPIFSLPTAFSGGAIRSQTSGLVSVVQSTVTGNSTAGLFAKGGGIWTAGPLTVVESNIVSNHTFGERGYGGGIASEGNIVLTSDSFSNNSTTGDDAFGGAIWTNGTLIAQDSTINNNETTGSDAAGGGVFAQGGLTANRLLVSQNRTVGVEASGGGLNVRQNLNITDSVISGNETVKGPRGGGIASYGNAIIARTSLSNNKAAARGGAISSRGNLSLSDSLVSGNVAQNGGGVYSFGQLLLSNSTISSNEATFSISGFGGGGIFALYSATITASTVTGNRLSGFSERGGGILIQNGALTISDSIVAKNNGPSGSPDIGIFSGSCTASSSLIGSNVGSGLAEALVGLPDANGNLIGGPIHGVIDPLLGPLADNGGFTLSDGSHILTMVLLPGSPAINAGDLNAVAGQSGVPEFDERGTPFGRVFGGRIDIGAFEYQAPSDLNLLVDTLVDESDGDYARGDLSLREAIQLANEYPGADTIHFDPALTAGGSAKILLTSGELAITDVLTIDGPGADLLTIDAQQQSRIFDITATTGDYTIDGLTLTGGQTTGTEVDNGVYALSGAAVRSMSTNTLTVNQCHITGNRVATNAVGGGIFTIGMSALEDSVLDGNFADEGGAIWTFGDASVVRCAIEQNSARFYGGALVWGALTLSESTISGNVGGGVYGVDRVTATNSAISKNTGLGIGSYQTVDVNGCVISGNTTYGIQVLGRHGHSTLSVTGSQFNENATAIWTYGDANIDDVSIANSPRGGIYAHGSLTLTSSDLSGNSTSDSGGAVFAGNSATLTNCTISNNSADQFGGGAYSGGPMSVTNCSITGNSAAAGGGLYCFSEIDAAESIISGNQAIDTGKLSSYVYGGGGIRARGSVALDDCVVSGNSVEGDLSHDGGGGILSLASVSLNRCSVTGNNAIGAHMYGGGVFCPSGQVDISDSSFIGNTAGGAQSRGGAINAKTATITLSTISGNSAQRGGGVSGRVFINFSTIVDNIGGGISGVAHLAGTIVAGNHAIDGSEQDIDGTTSAMFSFMGSSVGTQLAEAPIGTPDIHGNLIGGPIHGVIDPLLGPLADNGGFTLPDGSHILTMALLHGSPAINAGDPNAMAGVGGVPEFDERGAPFTRVADGQIDIGAIESQPNPLPGDYNFNGVVDTADYGIWRQTLGSTTDLRADGNGDGVVSQSDYDVWKANFGSALPASDGESAATSVAEPVAMGRGQAESGIRATTLDIALGGPAAKLVSEPTFRVETLSLAVRQDLLLDARFVTCSDEHRRHDDWSDHLRTHETTAEEPPNDPAATVDSAFALLGVVADE